MTAAASAAADPARLDTKAIPPFAALRAFEAVGRLGSIRKAAQALQVDHAVVSRHIRALEGWAGLSLIERSPSGGVLTAEGAAYHRRVSAAIAELADATRELTRRSDETRVVIWSVPGFAYQWLSDQLAAFERTQPTYDLELRPTDAPADLLRREADADIRFYGDAWSTPPGGRGLRHVEFARPAVMAVGSPDVVARLAGCAAVHDLLHHPLLHEEHDEQWRAWFRANGVEPPERIPGPRMWHAHVAIAAAKRGQGLALANRFLVAADLAEGRLAEVAIGGPCCAVIGGYAFVAREDRWRAPEIAALRRWLERSAGTND